VSSTHFGDEEIARMIPSCRELELVLGNHGGAKCADSIIPDGTTGRTLQGRIRRKDFRTAEARNFDAVRSRQVVEAFNGER
jgi:hypothetical protein